MRKWEYLDDSNVSRSELNALGRVGWELVTVYPAQNNFGDGGPDTFVFVFKRELKKKPRRKKRVLDFTN